MNDIAQRNLRLLTILEFLSKFSLFQGVIVVYFAFVTDSFALAMTALAMIHISASLFEVPTGVFSDHIGRRATLIINYFCWALAIFVYFLASSFLGLVVGAVINGFARAMKSGTSSAYTYENSELLDNSKEFTRQEGNRRAYGFYAEVISGLIGAAVIFLYDIRTAVFVTAGFAFFAFILSFWLVDVKAKSEQSSNIYAHFGEAWRSIMSDDSLKNISIAKMIAVGAGNVEYRYRSLLFASIMPEWLVSLVGAIGDMVTGTTMKYTHVLVKRLGYITNLVYVEVIGPIITAVLALVQTITAFFAMNIITSVIFGFREIAAENLLQEKYKKEQRATMGSIVGLGSSIVYSVLGIAIGLVADAIGLVYTMVIMQIFLALPAYFFYKGITAKS